MKKQKVLAVQLPASCPLNCSFCRTPNHGVGSMSAVRSAIFANISKVKEVYLTSNGETGFADGFIELTQHIHDQSVDISVLCATPRSVVPGLKRVEISYNQYTKNAAIAAMKKARRMNIPIIASVVDDDSMELSNLQAFATTLDVDGVLVRALQKEGRSQRSAGKTRFWYKDNVELGVFPIAAYRELEGFSPPPICINHEGSHVPFLGSPSTN